MTVRVCVSLPVHKYRLGRKPYMCICATVSIGFSIGFEIPVPPRASHTPLSGSRPSAVETVAASRRRARQDGVSVRGAAKPFQRRGDDQGETREE